MRRYFAFALLLLVSLNYSAVALCQDAQKPKVSFSFDDGSTSDFPGYSLEAWNKLLLDSLEKHEIKGILFVKGIALDNAKGKEIIGGWNDAGHLVGNHTYTHPYFNSEKVSLEQYERELLRNESFIKGYSNFTKLFRFPYLKEGDTVEKRDGFRKVLKEYGYRNGHVTIDASDWYIHKRLVKRLSENPDADLSGFKKFYIEHIFDRAQFYDQLALELTGRQISHNLLLHHNLTAALFADDLIQHFKDNGWEVVNANKAYEDDIYKQEPKNIPAGESLVWALAKQSGKYDEILRYPAEDSRYEKARMDELGL